MSGASIWLDRTTGDWWHKIHGRWVHQGNLLDVARNARRPDSDVVIDLLEARKRRGSNVT